ncbi:beta/gamma crystallin domain-containing protein [Streptomyces marokkonensis]|uniref:Beta/gamma crystallin domain-containing protein n=1 Tax=Streptomyces marokkonensis TaxID=324855 RepID=A0ABW6QJ02_9ACTN
MLKNVVRIAGTTLAAAVLATGFAGSASATNHVDCAGRNDFVTLWSTNGAKYCFANAGSLNLSVPVWQLGSGNNRVLFKFSNGKSLRFEKWINEQLDATVVGIEVY